MRRAALAVAAALAAAPAGAQDVVSAQGVILRGLDKVSGQTADVTLLTGETAAFGPLSITLGDCRYPADNPSADAFANLDIYDPAGNLLFGGWMVASSPALSALDHPRYDIWVLSCILPDPPAAPEAAPADESSSGG